MIKPTRDLHFLPGSLAGEYAERLRTAYLRVTRPRVAVLHAVHTAPHSDTEMIIRAVHGTLPDVSRQAVYDSLNALTSAGLLRRVQPSGMVARYESRVGDNHHHMVCRVCDAIEDVDSAVGVTPCLTASHATDYELDEAEVFFWGLCPACSEPDASHSVDDPAAPAGDGDHEQRPTTIAPQWNPPPVTGPPLATAEVGTVEPPANAVLISFDVAGAALTGYGRRSGKAFPPGADGERQ